METHVTVTQIETPIQKGVPIPPELFLVRRRFPFPDMQPGDSLLFTDPKEAESARAAVHQFLKRKKLKWVFKMLRSKDGEVQVWRMWRLA
jgi:hypothetical protein